jgi:hypothetical protein
MATDSRRHVEAKLGSVKATLDWWDAPEWDAIPEATRQTVVGHLVSAMELIEFGRRIGSGIDENLAHNVAALEGREPIPVTGEPTTEERMHDIERYLYLSDYCSGDGFWDQGANVEMRELATRIRGRGRG